MKEIESLDLKNKKVIIRCDFNVPIKDGEILDDTRIVSALKTIKYCLRKNAKVILMSHLGRIKTKDDLAKNDLRIVAEHLSELLNKEVLFCPKTRGKELEEMINNMQNKDILLMQNTRYEDLDGNKESSNDKELGEYWASLGDVFINDAFGMIHRTHASNVGIAENIKEKAIGFLIMDEIDKLSTLDNPPHPFIVIMGGAKVSDKAKMMENLLKKCDYILVGGALANTFLVGEGYDLGSSLVEEESIKYCQKILKKYADKIILPIDFKVNNEISNRDYVIKDITEFNYDDVAMDIGDRSTKIFEKHLQKAKLVLWNGPLGAYEYSNYRRATLDVLKFLVDKDIKTIIGGGDIVAASIDYKDKIYHISTGGGATLKYLEGKKLPSLKIME